ncbi:MAG: hypothetical protein Q4F27_02635 [Desulfovibrionaceae bacterium]|nr:hypothetical protein [Desulfovibrionaceae bacterium]
MKTACLLSLLLFILMGTESAFGHSALLNCYDNGDGTFTCQGGYSDGSSATGIRIVVRDGSNTVLQEARLDSNSEVVLQRPQGDFTVLFDGGSGHSVEVDGNSLVR